MSYTISSLKCHGVSLDFLDRVFGFHSNHAYIDHGAEATQHLAAFLGDHYMRSSEPVFQALWNTYNECQFVDDEGMYLIYKYSFVPDLTETPPLR